MTTTDVSDLAERVLKAAQLAHPIYVAHGWKWGAQTFGRTPHVPSVEEIADAIKRLYDIAIADGIGQCSSGRLCVYIDEDDGSITVDVQLADLRDEIPGWLL